MSLEVRWIVVAIFAVALGTTAAEPYARVMRPYYELVARAAAAAYPWEILTTQVIAGDTARGQLLTMQAAVRRHREDARPGALVESGLHVGAIVQLSVVFWSLVLGWPASSGRQRWGRLMAALPVFLSLEAATTVCQLMAPVGQISAMLEGIQEPVTVWEQWSRFIEAGGRILLALVGSVAVIALSGALGATTQNQAGAAPLRRKRHAPSPNSVVTTDR